MNFDTFPDYPRYRTLRLSDPMMIGYDVHALQNALTELGFDAGGVDGVFGRNTESAVKKAQSSFKITIDGLAGGETQKRICQRFFTNLRGQYNLPRNLLHGHVEHESGFRLGNYSPAREDGSYDAGVAQRNTAHTPAEQGFDVAVSLNAMASNTRVYYDKFAGVQGERRWQLAAGAWNAPAFASWIANEEGASVPRNQTREPGPTSRMLIEQYMKSVTAYM